MALFAIRSLQRYPSLVFPALSFGPTETVPGGGGGQETLHVRFFSAVEGREAGEAEMV